MSKIVSYKNGKRVKQNTAIDGVTNTTDAGTTGTVMASKVTESVSYDDYLKTSAKAIKNNWQKAKAQKVTANQFAAKYAERLSKIYAKAKSDICNDVKTIVRAEISWTKIDGYEINEDDNGVVYVQMPDGTKIHPENGGDQKVKFARVPADVKEAYYNFLYPEVTNEDDQIKTAASLFAKADEVKTSADEDKNPSFYDKELEKEFEKYQEISDKLTTQLEMPQHEKTELTEKLYDKLDDITEKQKTEEPSEKYGITNVSEQDDLKKKIEANKDVAATILQQLGGNKFIAMTGAKNFMSDNKGMGSLIFSLPKGAKNGANKVEIIFNGNDLYDVVMYKIGRDFNVQKVFSQNNIYAEDLRDVFTSVTGLYTSLGTMGKTDAILIKVQSSDQFNTGEKVKVNLDGKEMTGKVKMVNTTDNTIEVEPDMMPTNPQTGNVDSVKVKMPDQQKQIVTKAENQEENAANNNEENVVDYLENLEVSDDKILIEPEYAVSSTNPYGKEYLEGIYISVDLPMPLKYSLNEMWQALKDGAIPFKNTYEMFDKFDYWKVTPNDFNIITKDGNIKIEVYADYDQIYSAGY